MSDFDLETKSHIKEAQLAFLAEEVAALGMVDTADEALFQGLVKEALDQYQPGNHALFQPIPALRHQLPWKEDTLRNFREALADIAILDREQDGLGAFLVDSFNAVHSEKKRLLDRVGRLNNLTGDLNLLAGNDTGAVQYFKESFQDAGAMDESFLIDGVQRATLSLREGILTLGRLESEDLSAQARVAQVSGNGRPGVGQVARKMVVKDRYEEKEAFRFLSELDADYHAQVDSLLDGRPDTVFEYEMANVPESFKASRRHFDFSWAKGQPEGERLRLKLVFDLGEAGPLNWISLIPYYPYGSTGRLLLHSLQTSADGFRYDPVYPNHRVLNQSLSESPKSHQLEELFSGNTDPALANHTGQGVWVFPERTARYVEIVLDQDQSYPELLAQEVYTLSLDDEKRAVQIPAPEELKQAAPGEYMRTLDGERVVYTKELEAVTGWRYAIGLRDVHLMRHTYAEKSLFVSRRYPVDGEISRVVLYANEVIPASYQELVATMNDWIVYEVSFDDTNWHRISPMHHEPVNDHFPPKILEVNGSAVDLAAAFQIHKTQIETDGSADGVRLRITLSRPEGADHRHSTPLLEDVALKIEKKEDPTP